MRIIFALQLIVPLALITWLGFAPASSKTSLWVQIVATALALLAIALAGIWLFPPWWAIGLYTVLFVLAAFKALRKRRAATLWPAAWWDWSPALVFLLLGGYAAMQATLILAGSQAPPVAGVDLDFPLRAGTSWLSTGATTFASTRT